MEGKEEISDTDSGIILQSGSDSPTAPVKDVTTHTRAIKLKQQSLEDRLELCLLELRKLCIREAELTGKLSSDYPLRPGEQPPRIRRRIGASFKLDAGSILQAGENPELCSLEADLALQEQIFEAARKLCREEHLSKAVKRSRLQQRKRSERKVKELREAVFQLRLRLGRTSPCPGSSVELRDPGTSDDSSLSDSGLLDEEEAPSQSSEPSLEPPPLPDPLQCPQGPPPSLQCTPELTTPQTEEVLRPCSTPIYSPTVDYERPPIQNSPWMESSLDQPYQKTKKSRSVCSSQSSSPALTPVSTPVEPWFGDSTHPCHLTPIKNPVLRHTHSSSAPCTPEMHVRRQHSQSFRLPNRELSYDPDQNWGRSRSVRRRVTDFGLMGAEHLPLRMDVGNPLYHSSSEDSSSEHSAHSYASSSCFEYPAEVAKPCPSPYRYRYAGHHNGPMAFTGPSFYKNPMHQSTPSFYSQYLEEGMGYPPEVDMRRLHLGPPPSQHWYEEAPLQPVLRPLPAHARLARAPSLREHPHHHHSRGLPRDIVSEGLKSWHQRHQRTPRPRSLDRQGAVRLKSVQEQDSPTALLHQQQKQQMPQRQILQRAPDGTPVQWFVEEDSEIISQV
ncbi:innate immunity activator b isoform X1 [Megalops cyprinoides]|uniref:innate immunity activator b isoform X1 n=1 Tax=Megalops cyprinoides TaxID=118141 RepID=UPI00186432C4|nr:innate immunity activator b isoform X1 [Megalops cyprinoides]XP_036386222.1 innate immunity activator b isoform X1 [Megalops cyprinoides]